MTTPAQTQLQQVKRIAPASVCNKFPKLTDVPFALHGLLAFFKPLCNKVEHLNSGNTHCFPANYINQTTQPKALQVLDQLHIKGYKLSRFAHNPAKKYTSLTLIKIS